MPRFIATIVVIVALLIPANSFAQSGDATWLYNMEGLETAVGRSWTEPFAAEASPVAADTGTPESATPMAPDVPRISTLSALIYQYDSADNAAQGMELFREAYGSVSRDINYPATNAFEPDVDADMAIGNAGTYEAPNADGSIDELAVVYLTVQNGDLIYQIFGIFHAGNHIELATDVVEQMMNADIGEADPVYDMSGESTGGLWEKLNAIDIEMPEGSTIADLEVYPPADDAVMGDSVTVPQIDLDNLGAVPGLEGSWHITYAPEDSGVMTATPDAIPTGVFNIELWVMEFEDATFATATALSMDEALSEPLGVVTGEGGALDSSGITLVNSGFVRDRSLPEGDAATVVTANGSTVYAARVYANGPAPTPLATDLVASMIATEPGDDPETVSANAASGGMWDVFPQPGDEQLHGLEPAIVRFAEPSSEPMSTPVGWIQARIT